MQSRVAVFLGAGCSVNSPAEIPAAPQLAELLRTESGLEGESLEEIAEQLWNQGGWQEFVRILPRDKWRARQPNICHRVIAEICREGLIRELITTNWDILLESALSQAGQPYSVIVESESLDTEPMTSALVVKVHGCIDHPEHIKATTQDVLSPEWKARWVSALFETVLRTRALLFAGYSGASSAATSSIASLVSAEERTGFDVVVDHNSIDDMRAKAYGGEFLDALRLQDGSYIQSDTDEFFLALRNSIFPLLVGLARSDASALLSELLKPTQVPETAVSEAVNRTAELWVDSGPDDAQLWLLECFGATQDVVASRPYVPLRPRRGEIGRCFAWIALGLWVEMVQLVASQPIDLRVVAGDQVTQCIFAVSPPNRRRDIVARAIMGRRSSADRPRTSFLGVMFDGVGPLQAELVSFSASRGLPAPSIARGGSLEFRWVDGNEAFERLHPGLSVEQAQTELGEYFADLGREPRLDD